MAMSAARAKTMARNRVATGPTMSRLTGRRTWRIGLVTLLAGSIIGLVLLSSGGSGLVGWLATRRAVEHLLEDKSIAIFEQLSAEIGQELLPAERLVVTISNLIEQGHLDPTDDKAVDLALLEGVASSPSLTALLLARNGAPWRSAVRLGDTILTLDAADASLEPDGRQLLEKARRQSTPVWGRPVYAAAIDAVVVNVSQSVSVDGAAVAVVNAAISTEHLRDFVSTAARKRIERARPFILFGRDHVLAYDGDDDRRATSKRPLLPLAEVEWPPLRSLWRATDLAAREEESAAGIVTSTLDIPEGRFLILRKTFEGVAEEPLTLGVILPADILDEYQDALRRTALAALLPVLLGIVVALLVGRLLAGPIRRVSESADHVTALDLSAVDDLPKSRIKELDTLSFAFNSMLNTLRVVERYMPRILVQRLLHSGGSVPSQERDMTIMFTDIAGFTRMSEMMPAREVAAFLNDHFTQVARCVEAEGGTVDKYLGDGLMAFWGAPERLKGRAARGCRAALDIQNALESENRHRRDRRLSPVRLRIGLHRGPTIVGDIGSPSRVDYTVVGDTVNVAQRLQEAGRGLDPSAEVMIVVSDAIVEDAGPGFRFEPAGVMGLQGRDAPMQVFRLVGRVAEL
jgi:class 3 adenylate cyclase